MFIFSSTLYTTKVSRCCILYIDKGNYELYKHGSKLRQSRSNLVSVVFYSNLIPMHTNIKVKVSDWNISGSGQNTLVMNQISRFRQF